MTEFLTIIAYIAFAVVGAAFLLTVIQWWRKR